MAKDRGDDNRGIVDPENKTRIVGGRVSDPHAPTELIQKRPSDATSGNKTILMGVGEYAKATAPQPITATENPVVGWVVVVEGPGKGRCLPLGYGMNQIARSPTAQVPLDFGDDLVSPETHAVITFDPRNVKFYVQPGPGRARNLVYLGDAPVLAPQEIHSGQEITLGSTRLQFVALCGPDFDWQKR